MHLLKHHHKTDSGFLKLNLIDTFFAFFPFVKKCQHIGLEKCLCFGIENIWYQNDK